MDKAIISTHAAHILVKYDSERFIVLDTYPKGDPIVKEGKGIKRILDDSGTDPRLLAIRTALIRERYAIERSSVIAEQEARIRGRKTDDEEIMRLLAALDDTHRSYQRIGTRMVNLADIHAAETVRTVKDISVLARIIREGDLFSRASSISTSPSSQVHEILSALSRQITELETLERLLDAALQERITQTYPRFSLIATPRIAARLLMFAGSFPALARTHASKVQLLGAEAALFRHLRNKKNLPPKHGILHEHPLMLKARKADQGKIARMLADKLVIAARMDYFGSEDTSYAQAMFDEIEARIR